MAQDRIFDATAYFTALARGNRLARQEGFAPVTSTGLDNLEGILDEMRSQRAFIAIDDTGDTAYRKMSGCWYARRVWTVHVLHRYASGDLADRQKWLDVCRRVFRQMLARMIADRYASAHEGLWYLDTTEVMSREYPALFLDGVTGLYFTIAADEPLDLTVGDGEWEDGDGDA